MGVTDHSSTFLKYLEKHQLTIGTHLKLKTIEAFDHSIVLQYNKKELTISVKAAELVIVEEV
jgi:DtxR family Mn-dependent transcriptional regulator